MFCLFQRDGRGPASRLKLRGCEQARRHRVVCNRGHDLLRFLYVGFRIAPYDNTVLWILWLLSRLDATLRWSDTDLSHSVERIVGITTRLIHRQRRPSRQMVRSLSQARKCMWKSTTRWVAGSISRQSQHRRESLARICGCWFRGLVLTRIAWMFLRRTLEDVGFGGRKSDYRRERRAPGFARVFAALPAARLLLTTLWPLPRVPADAACSIAA